MGRSESAFVVSFVAMSMACTSTTQPLGDETAGSANLAGFANGGDIGGGGAAAGADATGAGGTPQPTAGAGGTAADLCSLDDFVARLVAARAASSAPSGCAAAFSLPLSGSARQTTADFVANTLGKPRESLQLSTLPQGTVSSANNFDLFVGSAGGNLLEIVHPFSVELQRCVAQLEITNWTATIDGVTMPTVPCLAGTSTPYVVGVCIFSQETCP